MRAKQQRGTLRYYDNSPSADSACKTADTITITESVCKKTDLVDRYFNDENKLSKKIISMQIKKGKTVFPQNGRR